MENIEDHQKPEKRARLSRFSRLVVTISPPFACQPAAMFCLLPRPNFFLSFPSPLFLFFPCLPLDCAKMYLQRGDDRLVSASRFCVCEGCINVATPHHAREDGNRGVLQKRKDASFKVACCIDLVDLFGITTWKGCAQDSAPKRPKEADMWFSSDHHEDHFAVNATTGT